MLVVPQAEPRGVERDIEVDAPPADGRPVPAAEEEIYLLFFLPFPPPAELAHVGLLCREARDTFEQVCAREEVEEVSVRFGCPRRALFYPGVR